MKILPCPFCGTESGCTSEGPVRCGNWNCSAKGPHFTDKTSALAEWNKRAQSPVEKSDALRDAERAFVRAAKKICPLCAEGVLLCGGPGVYDHETTSDDSKCKAEALYLERDALAALNLSAPVESKEKKA